MNPDYTRCEHRFYFKDKEEWSSWSESFEPGSITTGIESEIAEAEVRNVQPLFTAETIVEQLEDWLTDLEDNGLSAQCSLRVEMKVKDELGLLKDESKDDETTAEGDRE